MKRSAILIVCNGAQFIRSQLHHIYDMVDEIVVIEGADPTFQKVINSPRSTDGTIRIVRNFIQRHDISHKVKLKHINGCKNTMVRVGNQECTGDLIYHVDVDEFMKHESIDMAFGGLSRHSGVQIPQRWYYKWPDRYINCARSYAIQFVPVRFYRNRLDEGLLVNHIPPGFYYNPKTRKLLPIKSVSIAYESHAYHFLAIFRRQLEMKMKYYSMRDGVSPTIIRRRLQEYDTAPRTIGHRIDSYKGSLLEEKNPFPIAKINDRMRLCSAIR